jgi:hypothetical protein
MDASIKTIYVLKRLCYNTFCVRLSANRLDVLNGADKRKVRAA